MTLKKKFVKYHQLYIFLAPALVLTFLFSYLSMFSNVVAFMNYDLFAGWMGLQSEWVGFDNFSFVTEDWFLALALRTLYYSIGVIVFSFPASLILALLFNEVRSKVFKKVTQTISYVPHFVSWVTVGGLVYIFLSIDPSGLVNNIKVALFGGERIVIMQNSGVFLPLLIISQTWKEIGWGSILYLASMASIDPQLYEAAEADGAGRWKKMLHITLPGLIPTTIILMIFSLGALFSGNFDQMFNLQNQVIQEDTDIISTFTYYRGIQGQEYSIATAVGLFSGLISFLLLYGANYIGKKVNDTSII